MSVALTLVNGLTFVRLVLTIAVQYWLVLVVSIVLIPVFQL